MKTKLTFEFANIAEATTFLGTIGGGHKVEVASSTTTSAPTTAAVASEHDPLGIGKVLAKYTKTELKSVCAERGLPYSSAAKNSDLLALIQGGGVIAPAIEAAPVAAVPVPPVINEAPIAIPTAVVTEVAPAVGVSKGELLGQFSNIYDTAIANRVDQGLLNSTVGSQIRLLGYAEGTKLGGLSDAHLQQFIGMFQQHAMQLTNSVVQQPVAAGNGFV